MLIHVACAVAPGAPLGASHPLPDEIKPPARAMAEPYSSPRITYVSTVSRAASFHGYASASPQAAHDASPGCFARPRSASLPYIGPVPPFGGASGPQDAALLACVNGMSAQGFSRSEISALTSTIAAAELRHGALAIQRQLALFLPQQWLTVDERTTVLADLQHSLVAGPAKQLVMLAIASNFTPGGPLLTDGARRARALHRVTEEKACDILGMAEAFCLPTMPAAKRLEVLHALLRLPEGAWRHIAKVLNPTAMVRPETATAMLVTVVCETHQNTQDLTLWQQLSALHGSAQQWQDLEKTVTAQPGPRALLLLQLTELLCRDRQGALNSSTLALIINLSQRPMGYLVALHMHLTQHSVGHAEALSMLSPLTLGGNNSAPVFVDQDNVSNSCASSLTRVLNVQKSLLLQLRCQEINRLLQALWLENAVYRPEKATDNQKTFDCMARYCDAQAHVHKPSLQAKKAMVALQAAMRHDDDSCSQLARPFATVLYTVWRVLDHTAIEDGGTDEAERMARLGKKHLLSMLARVHNAATNEMHYDIFALSLLLTALPASGPTLPVLAQPLASEWVDYACKNLLEAYKKMPAEKRNIELCLLPWLDESRHIYGRESQELFWISDQLQAFTSYIATKYVF